MAQLTYKVHERLAAPIRRTGKHHFAELLTRTAMSREIMTIVLTEIYERSS
jgi:hypothetical protein